MPGLLDSYAESFAQDPEGGILGVKKAVLGILGALGPAAPSTDQRQGYGRWARTVNKGGIPNPQDALLAQGFKEALPAIGLAGLTVYHGSPHKFPPVVSDDLKKVATEYEGRLFGGAYSDWFVNKGGPKAGMIQQARIVYNGLRKEAGLSEISDWSKAPNDLIQKMHSGPQTYPLGKFDMSKVGTGEGAQAYGHGLYLAENPGVAQSYRQVSTPEDFKKAVDALWPILRKSSPFADDSIAFGPIRSKLSKTDFAKMYERNPDAVWSELRPEARTAVEKALSGNLYKVDLPDEQIAKMLDWDKPLSQQPESVRKLLHGEAVKLAEAKSASARSSLDAKFAAKGLPSPFIGKPVTSAADTWSGRYIYDALSNQLGSKVEASEYMRQLGIPGIKYLDQGSRGAGQGTYNFVIFDDQLPKILGRE